MYNAYPYFSLKSLGKKKYYALYTAKCSLQKERRPPLSLSPPLQFSLLCQGLNEARIVQGSKDWPRVGEAHQEGTGSLDSKPVGLGSSPDSLKGLRASLSPL